MDLYNMQRTEHYERVERDRDIKAGADEKEGGIFALKKLLAEYEIMRTTPIQDWPMFHREKDLIDLHEQESEERDNNFNN